MNLNNKIARPGLSVNEASTNKGELRKETHQASLSGFPISRPIYQWPRTGLFVYTMLL